MEVTQMLDMHSILIKIFLGFLVLGLIIPFVTSKNPRGFRKASFIHTMIFQAIATMIAFAGLVAVVTGDLGWSITTIIMIIIWAIMMYIEIKKYKLIKLANLDNIDTHSVLKWASVKISIINIFLVTIMVVLMILKAKGIVNI